MNIRLARAQDARAIAEIYAPIVEHTAISFESEPPDAEEIRARIEATLPRWPWIVSVSEQGDVCGYAYAGMHRKRSAYGWSVESSVYVAESARGQGVGKTLYAKLIDILRAQNFATVYGGVVLPNDASLALHHAFGFEEIGVYKGVGYKHGQWRDVWWGALDLLSSREDPPKPLLDLDTLCTQDEWADLLLY